MPVTSIGESSWSQKGRDPWARRVIFVHALLRTSDEDEDDYHETGTV